MKKWTSFWVFILLIMTIQNALAGNDRLLKLIGILRDNGTISQTQYKMLMDAAEEESPTKPLAETSQGNNSQELKLTTRGGIEVTTYDGMFSFELGGRLMVDAAAYDEDEASMGDGTELRRARVELKGDLLSDWSYSFGVDFADKDADVKNAYLQYKGFWPFKLRMGHFKVPFSLEESTSSKYITFMERALLNEFAPERHIGLGAYYCGGDWTVSGGLFGESFDKDTDDEGDEGWQTALRLTYSPVHRDTRSLHFGTAVVHEALDDEKTVKFSVRPESHVTDVKFVDTGKIKKTDAINKIGVEAAGVWGPFSVQGEYVYVGLDRSHGFDDVDFWGWYLYGSWFVTGESRIYKVEKGKFGKIKPIGKNGALEVALRYSTIDLDDGPIAGGREKNITIGLNWYINPYIRFMGNYIIVNNNNTADMDGDGSADNDPNIFQTRLQVFY